MAFCRCSILIAHRLPVGSACVRLPADSYDAVNACYEAGLRAYGTSAQTPRGHDHDQYMPGYYCAGVYDFDMNMVEIVYGGSRSVAPPSKVPSSIASWQKDVAQSTVSGVSESRRAPLVPIVNESRPPLLRSESEPRQVRSENQGSHMLIGTLLGAAAGAIMTYAATSDKKKHESRPSLSQAGIQRAASYHHIEESPPAYTQVQRSSTYGPVASAARHIPLAIEAARELSAAASRFSQQRQIAPEPYATWREAIEQSPSVASSSRYSKTLVSDNSRARAPSSHTSYTTTSSKTITQDRYLSEKWRDVDRKARDVVERASKIADGSTHSRAPGRSSSRESRKRYPPVSYVPPPSSHRRSRSHAPSAHSHRTSFRVEEEPIVVIANVPSKSGRSEHSRKHSSSHRRSSSAHGSRMSSSRHERRDEKSLDDDEIYPDDSISCVGTVVTEKPAGRESRHSRRSEGKREGGLRRLGGSLFGR